MNINIIDILKRFWWLILIITILVISFTIVFTLKKKPLFNVYTTFIVSPKVSSLNVDQRLDSMGRDIAFFKAIDTLHRRTVIATISRILTSERLKKQIIYSLKVDRESRKSLKLKSSVIPDTNIIKIFVTGDDPQLCLSFAKEIDKQSNDIVGRYYELYTLKRLDRPSLPNKPISPVIERNVVAATIVGVLLGLITAFIIMFVEIYKTKKN